MDKVVIVLGPYRSGTSLVSQILSDLGVWFGPEHEFQLPADRYNPGGYFQRRDVVEANRRLIESASGSMEAPPAPEQVSTLGHQKALSTADLTWSCGIELSGLKDPRFSVTLLSWIRADKFAGKDLRVIRLERPAAAVVASAMRHREVGSFCDYDASRLLRMSELYDRYARWHIMNLDLPSTTVSFDRLIKDTDAVVTELAMFLSISDAERVACACNRVGKRRALIMHYLKKFGSPQRLFEAMHKTVAHWLKR